MCDVMCSWWYLNLTHVLYSLLDVWVSPTPKQALDLLDARFADATVRAFAVAHLKPMTDEELSSYALQLVQVLKYEQQHVSLHGLRQGSLSGEIQNSNSGTNRIPHWHVFCSCDRSAART
eukprot:SAG31_NODE_208_length_20313_cov_6.143119_4_plen_120_part_00